MKMIFFILLKELQQLRRDKGSLRLMIIIPMVQLFVLGNAITTEVKHTPIALLDYSQSSASRDLTTHILANSLFTFKGYAHSESELRAWMDAGKIKIGLLIGANFATELEQSTRLNSIGLQKSSGALLQIIVDGQDANSSTVANGYLNAILIQWSNDYLQYKLAASGIRLRQILPLNIESKILFNPTLKSTWFMIPGIAVILVTMVTALLTGFSIVKEKEVGTLEQLMVTPLKPYQLVLGKVLPFFIIGVIELLIVLCLGLTFFHIPFRGSYFTLFLFTSIYMLSSLGIGIFTSTLVKSQQQALFVIWFFLIFFLLLSGFFLPIENMPHWVQNITYLNPVRYFMEALRCMFLKGSGLAELWPQALALLAIGGSLFGFAILRFNRQTD